MQSAHRYFTNGHEPVELRVIQGGRGKSVELPAPPEPAAVNVPKNDHLKQKSNCAPDSSTVNTHPILDSNNPYVQMMMVWSGFWHDCAQIQSSFFRTLGKWLP